MRSPDAIESSKLLGSEYLYGLAQTALALTAIAIPWLHRIAMP